MGVVPRVGLSTGHGGRGRTCDGRTLQSQCPDGRVHFLDKVEEIGWSAYVESRKSMYKSASIRLVGHTFEEAIGGDLRCPEMRDDGEPIRHEEGEEPGKEGSRRRVAGVLSRMILYDLKVGDVERIINGYRSRPLENYYFGTGSQTSH